MFQSVDTEVGLCASCHVVQRKLGSGKCSCSRFRPSQGRWAAFPCLQSPGAWPAGRRGLGLRALGLFLAVEMWDCGRRHKYSLGEVADSEVLARGECRMNLFIDGFVYSSFTLLLLWVGASKGHLSVSGSRLVAVSEVSPSASTTATLVPVFLNFVVK